ncbi:MAG: prepilin-type N-terminal cleavage/methylation domain-containing protein [Aerococcus sp.]|nr:prepilin-type N-terminal cleavage/methylation domain-containing protein [Aerococcus sp.]
MRFQQTKTILSARRGLTLIEAVVSMGLFSLFLMIWFGNMEHQLTQLSRDQQQLEQNEKLLQHVLNQESNDRLVLLGIGVKNEGSPQE